MNGFNLSTAQGIYVGSQLVSEVYYGSTKIWPLLDYSQDYLTFEADSIPSNLTTQNA